VITGDYRSTTAPAETIGGHFMSKLPQPLRHYLPVLPVTLPAPMCGVFRTVEGFPRRNSGLPRSYNLEKDTVVEYQRRPEAVRPQVIGPFVNDHGVERTL
jgi:hypothetical protein